MTSSMILLSRKIPILFAIASDLRIATQPSISTRALRLMTAFLLPTAHFPAQLVRPTLRYLMDVQAYRFTTSPPAARLTKVPGIAAAVPIATAAVPIMAMMQFAHRQGTNQQINISGLNVFPLEDV